MKLLLLDNNDSFTYNLLQLLDKAGCKDISIRMSKDFNPEDAEQFDKIVFSPGPGLPGEFPVMHELLRLYGDKKSFLGICLGHQAIASFYGAGLLNMPEVSHGRQSEVEIHTDCRLFKGINSPVLAGLYHSWIVDPIDFPVELEIIAKSKEGRIMGLKHRNADIYGLQFHPESIMTPEGLMIIRNWLS